MSKAKLAQIDYLAVSQDSRLHAWSVLPKTIAFAAVLFGIVFSQRPRQVFLLLSILLLTLASSKLPLWLCRWALYPAFFSLPFALAKFSASPLITLLMVTKAMLAALLLLTLAASTPFPQLLSVLALFLPPLLVDTVWFTYRLFFILLGKALQMLSALRRRGAFARGNFCWSCRMVFNAWGWLLLLMLQVSQQLMQSYRLRGYDHSLPAQVECPPAGRRDWLGAMLSIALVGGVLLLG